MVDRVIAHMTTTLVKTKPFNKAALFTDIHWGRANNSEVQNKDCLSYILWCCQQVRDDPDIDCVMFLGDWHQHRSAINGLTLKYSYKGAKLLNKLGLPIYMIIGNHDLYNRNNRDVNTTHQFESLTNITMVYDEPVILEANNTVLFPYLFGEEYHTVLPKYSHFDVIMGHFEFQGFVTVGDNKVLEHGADHTIFDKPKRIFSGHFHKRQSKDNVFYIGNAFPMDFGDANDSERGMATYEFATDTLEYINWPDCPMYIKCKLSDLLDNPTAILSINARVRCLVDIPLSFEESNVIKEKFIKKFKLRELSLEDTTELNDILEDTEFTMDGMELESTDNIIKEMLRQLKSEKIDSNKLVSIYEGLR